MICFQEKLMACDDSPVNTKTMNPVGTIELAVYSHYVHTKQANSFQ